MGHRRRGIKLILWVPVAGIHECRVVAMSSKGCHGNGHALMEGRGTCDVGGGYQGRGGTARTILFRWTSCWPKLRKSGWLGRCFARRSAVRGIGKKGYSGGSLGGRWDPVGLLVVALLRLVPQGHRVEGCLGGLGGALLGGREPSVVSGRG